MKVNKKAVLSTAAVLGVSALAIGGTIAYFTDHATETNTFTVGDVSINLYESQLHRQNSGRQGSFGALASDPNYCDWNANPNDSGLDTNTGLIKGSYEKARYCTPGMNAGDGNSSSISAIANGHTRTGFSNANRTWGYADDTIKADAAAYKAVAGENNATEDGYFTTVSEGIAPGQWVRKFSYVENTGHSDAYVLIRYMIPTEYADKLDIKVPGTPYEEDVHADQDGHQGYFTALTKNDTNGEYEAYDSSVADSMDYYTGYVEEVDGTEYRIFAAVTTEVVNPGEMTFWSPVNTVRLKTSVDSTDFSYQDAIDIRVDADAIQAKTFSDAVEAINALQ
ncbi:SipW-dependent-type signal peptide-containing protein [Candidatus Saccharibacteria bacterium]|nr:SipW-dependent-type signal peptide-containing protein [Candidatus Saccharibacteria bacterium]